MEFITDLFKKEATKEISVFLLIVLFFYSMRKMLNLFLLTFLFTFLIYSLQQFIVKKFLVKNRLNELLVTIILYILLISMFSYFVYKYVPIIINESAALLNQLSASKDNSSIIMVQQYIDKYFGPIDIKGYIKGQVDSLFLMVANIGKMGINVFLAFILSLFFMLEKQKIKLFLSKFKTSRVSSIYNYIEFFWTNFSNSFGKVIQAQILIAMINTIISIIILSIMRFPQIIALGFMIFICGLIPVAGVIISLVPLSIIAFNIGGITKVIYVMIMIAMLHSLESYVLNPKLMSDKTELPVFFTFLILIVSEHFMGTWGLLLGIPLVMFILDLLKVNVSH